MALASGCRHSHTGVRRGGSLPRRQRMRRRCAALALLGGSRGGGMDHAFALLVRYWLLLGGALFLYLLSIRSFDSLPPFPPPHPFHSLHALSARRGLVDWLFVGGHVRPTPCDGHLDSVRPSSQLTVFPSTPLSRTLTCYSPSQAPFDTCTEVPVPPIRG